MNKIIGTSKVYALASCDQGKKSQGFFAVLCLFGKQLNGLTQLLY